MWQHCQNNLYVIETRFSLDTRPGQGPTQINLFWQRGSQKSWYLVPPRRAAPSFQFSAEQVSVRWATRRLCTTCRDRANHILVGHGVSIRTDDAMRDEADGKESETLTWVGVSTLLSVHLSAFYSAICISQQKKYDRTILISQPASAACVATYLIIFPEKR